MVIAKILEWSWHLFRQVSMKSVLRLVREIFLPDEETSSVQEKLLLELCRGDSPITPV